MLPFSHPFLSPSPRQGSARWVLCNALFALSVTGCIQGDGFAHGDAQAVKACKAGNLGCFCRARDQSCKPGLMCIDDRCVDPDAESPAQSEASSSDTGSASSSQAPDNSKSGADEQPEQGSQNTDEPDEPDANGDACQQDEDCEDQNPCTVDRCVDSFCRNEEQEGLPCDDQDPCTGSDQCQAGKCVGKDTRVLNENFASLPLTWFGRRGTIDDGFVPDPKPSNWQIGGAVPSRCGGEVRPDCGEDPAQDFSPGADNMLAGVVIGGCHEQVGDWVWDCFFSPFFETGFFDTEARFSYRRHLHAPGVRIDGRKRGVEHRIVLRGVHDSIETLIQGYEGVTNDRSWIEDSKLFEGRAKPTSIGFCYRRSSFSNAFAGWSIDEVRVAQNGCAF